MTLASLCTLGVRLELARACLRTVAARGALPSVSGEMTGPQERRPGPSAQGGMKLALGFRDHG